MRSTEWTSPLRLSTSERHCADVAQRGAVPWWLLVAERGLDAGLAASSSPRDSTTYSPPWSSGRTPGSHSGSAGSSPAGGTHHTAAPGVRTGVQACFAPRPAGVRYPVAPRTENQCRHGGHSVDANEAHVDAHLRAMQEAAGSRPAIRSQQARLAKPGRRAELRPPCPSGRPGSTPGAGTQRVVGKRPSHLLWEQGTVGSSPTYPT